MAKPVPFLVLAGALALAAPPARAADLTALVEDASGVAGVAAFDYLGTGRTVELGAGGTLVLNYIESCVRETIAGGTVTVGEGESTVKGGRVQREDMKCDKGALRLTAGQSTKSGAFAMRSLPGDKPELTVFALSPVFDVTGTGRLTIERVDQKANPVTLDLVARNALKPGLYDLSKANVALAPGGIYRAKVGNQTIVFEVDSDTKDRTGPLLGRLVRF